MCVMKFQHLITMHFPFAMHQNTLKISNQNSNNSTTPKHTAAYPLQSFIHKDYTDWIKPFTSSKRILLLLASNQKCPPLSIWTTRICSPQCSLTLLKYRRYRPVVNAKISPPP